MFLDPLVVTVRSSPACSSIGCQILVQRLPVYRMTAVPAFLSQVTCLMVHVVPSVYRCPWRRHRRIDLLLQLLKCQLMGIPHPKVLFDRSIFAVWGYKPDGNRHNTGTVRSGSASRLSVLTRCPCWVSMVVGAKYHAFQRLRL